MNPQNVLLQLGRCSAMDEEELVNICWHTIDVMVRHHLHKACEIDINYLGLSYCLERGIFRDASLIGS